jgi:hypothetical protein
VHSRLGSLIVSAAVAAALIAPAAASAQAPELNVSDHSVVEGAGAEIWFDVSRGAPTDNTTYFGFGVSPGTALYPDDYGQFFDSDGVQDGILNFSPGITTLRITVPIVNDSLFEADEDLFVNLTPGGVNGTIVDGQGHGTILNDDGAAPPPTALPIAPPISTTPAPAPKPKKKCKKKGKKASAAKKCKK